MARNLPCWADVGPSGHWRPVHRKQLAYTGRQSPRVAREKPGIWGQIVSRRSVVLNENVLTLEDAGRLGARACPMGLVVRREGMVDHNFG